MSRSKLVGARRSTVLSLPLSKTSLVEELHTRSTLIIKLARSLTQTQKL